MAPVRFLTPRASLTLPGAPSIAKCATPPANKRRIELHGQANPINDASVAQLCEELNATGTHYPGTSLRLKYVRLTSSYFLLVQDV